MNALTSGKKLRQTLKRPLTRVRTPGLAKGLLHRGLDWQGQAEFVRSRVIYKSLDAVLTASLQPRRNRQDYLETIFNWDSSNYKRIAACTNLVDTFFPGAAKRFSAKLTNGGRFPLAADAQLMSYGSGSTVFLIKRPERDWVLKVYRRSLGKSPQSLAQIAHLFKAKYETVHSWYSGDFNLVPPACFLIFSGPIFGRPAAGVLQGYIEGEKSDFFLDFSNQDLLAIMESDPDFAAQFLFFAEQTRRIYEQHDQCVDFLGQENLMMVKKDGRYRILIIDYGIFNMSSLMHTAPSVYGRIMARLERMQYLKGALR